MDSIFDPLSGRFTKILPDRDTENWTILPDGSMETRIHDPSGSVFLRFLCSVPCHTFRIVTRSLNLYLFDYLSKISFYPLAQHIKIPLVFHLFISPLIYNDLPTLILLQKKCGPKFPDPHNIKYP